MSTYEKELIEKGVIDSSQVCISCGEGYAPDGMICYKCKNKEIKTVKNKSIKNKILEFIFGDKLA